MRGTDALPLEETIELGAADAQEASDPHALEPAVVDEAPDRLRVHAEAVGDLAHAHELVARHGATLHRDGAGEPGGAAPHPS